MMGEFFNKAPAQFFPMNPSAPPVWLLGVLVVAVAIVAILTKREGWQRFALKRKWLSRIAVLVLAVFIVVPLESVAPIIWSLLPGKIEMETPNLTIIAIKLGITGLYAQHEIANRLPDKKALVDCIGAISTLKAAGLQAKCAKDDIACMENIPPSSRANLIDAIKDSQKTIPSDITMGYTAVRTPCKLVDASKL